jgi:hypothetical protein
MKDYDSQIRYSTLLIVEELFARSKYFRALLLADFKAFLELCVGFKEELPPPQNAATLLREKCIELVEKWTAEYGKHYRQLHVGQQFLRGVVQRRRALQQSTEQLRQRIKVQQIVTEKYKKIVNSIDEFAGDVQLNVDEIVGHLTKTIQFFCTHVSFVGVSKILCRCWCRK